MDTFISHSNLVSFPIDFSLKTYINVIFPSQTSMQPFPKTFSAKSLCAVLVSPQPAHKPSTPTAFHSTPISHLKFYMHVPCFNHLILLHLTASLSHEQCTLWRSSFMYLALSCNILISWIQILSRNRPILKHPHQCSHGFEHLSVTQFDGQVLVVPYYACNMLPALCTEIEALWTSFVVNTFNFPPNGLIPFFLRFHAFSPSTVPRHPSCAIYRCPPVV
jgi:hypothetical protein